MDEEKERNPEGQRDKEKGHGKEGEGIAGEIFKGEKFYRNGILEVRIQKTDNRGQNGDSN